MLEFPIVVQIRKNVKPKAEGENKNITSAARFKSLQGHLQTRLANSPNTFYVVRLLFSVPFISPVCRVVGWFVSLVAIASCLVLLRKSDLFTF